MATFISASLVTSCSIRNMATFISASLVTSCSTRITSTPVTFSGGNNSPTTQYLMKAFRTHDAITETVYWSTTTGTIDTTGAQSPYPTNQLTFIRLVKTLY